MIAVAFSAGEQRLVFFFLFIVETLHGLAYLVGKRIGIFLLNGIVERQLDGGLFDGVRRLVPRVELEDFFGRFDVR